MIPDETVERIREAADIVQIIGEHVSLRRVGADYRGPCPFHQGTHRNFSVSPKKRMYYCFVCHEGGDVFNFLQKRLGLEWPAAVRLVGEKSGIEVREVESRRDEPDPREPLWEINAAAADFFQRLLWEDESAREARDYLAGRNLPRAVAERFGIGFAPRDPGAVRAYLNGLGFGDDRLLQAGLLVRREEGGEVRPRFRGRVIFPILDAAGRHVGFGGRLLGPGEPKYLNSAESPVFSKGKLLYGLYWARNAIRRDERVLVVEGYFDVVRLIVEGLESVVAPLGTALTPEQAALIRRYTTNVFLLYDSDRAGLRATFRSGDALLAVGASVQVVTLPEGEDPDTFVDRHGIERLRAELDTAIDVFERKVQLLERAGWFRDLRRRRRAIDRLLPTIRVTADPLTRDLYLARAAEAAGVSKDLLQRELGEPAPLPRIRSPERGSRRTAPAVAVRRRDRRDRYGEHGVASERELIRVMLHRREQVEALAERVGPVSFRDPRYQEIFSALLEMGADVPVADLSGALSGDSVEVMQELLSEPGAIVDLHRTVEGSLASLRRREIHEELEELDRLLGLATGAEKDAQIQRKNELVQELRSLGGIGRNYGKSRS